ncbi:alpha-amylase family glycosyl hydrolase [Ornithinibacillus contaminans]|uniref:alpha-amylase family glycosyl hydrolase n=1 Tax=Ornithinibacillus contaminans TaxID=694055 RepID=UPI00064DD3E5|nr:alpha-amylase family glycosyl hydrolase [Ornithinibacillus contaminans]
MWEKLIAFILVLLVIGSVAPVHAAEQKASTWQDEIIYFVMIDRFNNGDTANDYQVDSSDPSAYHGGDFQGIMEKLDYIKEMGFTAIWLTPIVNNEAKGYHGYWTEDFYEVEEHFGTLDEFKLLVQEAHNRDIKIILDLVVNHTGYEHPWLSDPDKHDWFHEDKPILNSNDQNLIETGRLAGLPDLAQENPEVREYLLDMAKWWIEETDIDGYRLDTVKHVPKDFWEDFSKEVKAVKEDFFLIGEVWHNDPTYVADYAKTGIDSFVDYPFYNEATRIFSSPDQAIGKYMNGIWQRNAVLYENPSILGNFIDNHDNKRFTRLAIEKDQDPVSRLKQALTYLYTAPGIPIVYYGTEIAMDGGEDPDNRRMMEFQDHELVSYISELGKIRQEYPALSRGDYELLLDQAGMTVFKRSDAEQSMLVAINNTTADQTVTMTNDMIEANQQLRAVLGEGIISGNSDGYVIRTSSESAEIFVIEDEEAQLMGMTSWVVGTGGLVIILGIVFLIVKRKKVKP